METDISPLAKRLAEENNVNWRSLAGSGSSGRVVERDVLEYLARVMAGEEDLNPTAEPVPEGMEAWPEEDVQGYTATATATDESDDAMFGDAPDGSMPSVSASRNDGFADDFEEEAIDEDIFLFDDDETELSQSQDAYTETFGTPSAASAEADIATSESVDLDDAFATEESEDAAFGQDAVEADGLEDDLFTIDEPETDVDEDVSLFVGEAVTSDEESVSEEPVTFGDTFSDEPVASSEATFDDDFAADTFAVEESFEEVGNAPTMDSVETENLESLEPESFEADPTFAAPVADEVGTAFAEADTVESSIEESVAEPAAVVAATETPDASAETSDLPLVSYGVLLRRRVDLGALTVAQVAIGQELGQDPVSPTSLLLRAAAKAASEHQLGSSIGLVTLGTHASVSTIEDAGTMTFKDLVTRIGEEQATLDKDADHKDEVGLAVADLSHLNIDEAVLNLGMPVLTLGRVLHDSDEGTHYSTLTLSGEVEVETGTQLLAAVAELLASPIRLVM